MTTLSYGDNLTVDTAALPQASVDALIRRGWSHLMGSEAASKVKDYADKNPACTDADKAAYKATVQAGFIEALTNGTLGARAVGPRATPIESVMREIAEREIRKILGDNKLPVPSKKKPLKLRDTVYESMTAMVAARVAKDDARLRPLAEAEMKRRERDAAKVAAEGLDSL